MRQKIGGIFEKILIYVFWLSGPPKKCRPKGSKLTVIKKIKPGFLSLCTLFINLIEHGPNFDALLNWFTRGNPHIYFLLKCLVKTT